MKKLILALAVAACFPAFAQSTADSNVNGVSASANPVSGNSQAASNVQGVSAASNPNNQAQQSITFNSAAAPATQGVQYSGGTTSDVRYSGGTTSTDNVNYSGTQTLKNVPGIAMSGPASGPCTGNSGGVGIAGPGFGVGLNGAKVDDGCTVRENTRVLGQVYQSIAAGPIKDEAAAAVLSGLRILANMNAKIGGDYPAPVQPKVAETAAPVRPVASGEPTDPYVRSRMGLPVASK